MTRTKSNILFDIEYYLPCSDGVILDCMIRLIGPGGEKYPTLLRRVVVQDPETGRNIAFITNNTDLPAATIGAVYKDRWQIELFFKALKQNLKIKTFLGTTPNADKTQIWTALIAILLLKFMQLKASFGWSLSNLAAMVRMNLLTYRDLFAWLNDPFQTPITGPGPLQLELDLS